VLRRLPAVKVWSATVWCVVLHPRLHIYCETLRLVPHSEDPVHYHFPHVTPRSLSEAKVNNSPPHEESMP